MTDLQMALVDSLPAAFLDVLPYPVFIVGVPSGRVLRWNRAAEQQCDRDVLTSATLPALLRAVQEDGRPLSSPGPLARALTEGAALADMDAILRSRSSTRPVAVSVQPARDAAGHTIAALVMCYPTARWAEARPHARRTEERLAIALAAAGLGSWEFDLQTRLLTASPQCKANHGFGPDEDMQLDPHVLSALPDDDRARFVAAVEQAIATQGSFDMDMPNQWRDGTEHWIQVAGRVVDATTLVGVSQDISDRRRVEQALRDSEEQYRAIVDAANEGIWRVDHEARITFVNHRMAEMLAVTPEAMVGRHKWDFVFDEDVAAMRGLFERRKQGVSEEVADIRFRRGDGREVWTLMAARPLYDALGRFVGAVDLFTDITERRRGEEELRESDRRKEEFLAVLAHELRGPLAPILTAVKLLQAKGPTEPALQRLRDTIYRQAMQISTLVEDLLDVGRITAGKVRLDRRRVDLRDIARQAVEVSTVLIERHKHTLTVRLPDRPVHVDADAGRLVQVASNLLNNAAKYTADGGQIELIVRDESGKGVVSVRDRGVGIPPEMLERIFDRFVQVGSSGHRAEGGLGIGLSVVKALVDLHGGSVEARSEGIGKGSEFTARVPLADVTASV